MHMLIVVSSSLLVLYVTLTNAHMIIGEPALAAAGREAMRRAGWGAEEARRRAELKELDCRKCALDKENARRMAAERGINGACMFTFVVCTCADVCVHICVLVDACAAAVLSSRRLIAASAHSMMRTCVAWPPSEVLCVYV